MMERAEYHGESELKWEPVELTEADIELLELVKKSREAYMSLVAISTQIMTEPKRNHYYPPNTPEMEAIMLRMIEELPDGTYRIKTTRDDLDNSKS